jgi:dTDP-4-dehydrorhamnose reductase
VSRKVCLVGGEGLLGRAIRSVATGMPGVTVVSAGHRDADVTRVSSIRAFLRAERPDIVVNLAALMPADSCETRPAAAFAVNTRGARIVAEQTEDLSAAYFYLSSDFVFSGEASLDYGTRAERRPVQVYGRTKAEGEDQALAHCRRTSIIRTACLFSRYADTGRSRTDLVNRTLTTVRSGRPMRVVDDLVMSPTFVEDAAAMIVALFDHPPIVFHAVNDGRASWFELCKEAVRLAGLDTDMVVPVSSAEMPTAARRPRRVPLSIREQPRVVEIRSWREALTDCLERER